MALDRGCDINFDEKDPEKSKVVKPNVLKLCHPAPFELENLACWCWLKATNGQSSQVFKLFLFKFHRNRTRKYYNTALFVGGCWVSLIGCFHRHSAADWAECTVAGLGRVRRHAAQSSKRSSTPLIGHARVALSGVLTRLLSKPKNDTQRSGKGHKPLPAPYLPWLAETFQRGIVRGDKRRRYSVRAPD